MEKMLKVNVSLLHMIDYSRFNKVYEEYFIKDLPARFWIEAIRRSFDISIEIDAIANI